MASAHVVECAPKKFNTLLISLAGKGFHSKNVYGRDDRFNDFLISAQFVRY